MERCCRFRTIRNKLSTIRTSLVPFIERMPPFSAHIQAESLCSYFWMQEMRINPYLLHFGNIQERHLWKKNPKFTFWSLMTSYMTNNLWRHMNLKLHQLGYLYVTWPKSRDVIRVRYHVMKVITPEKPGTELASFLEKKSRRVWERLGASFLEKISKNGFFG